MSIGIDTLFPFQKDESKMFGFYLEKTAIDRIVKLSFVMMWLTLNYATVGLFGRVETNPVPTGLSDFRFGMVMFLISYGYFLYWDRIYKNAYRTCHSMELVDTEDTEVLNRLDPDRDEKALEILDQTVENAKDQLDEDDLQAQNTANFIDNKLRKHFSGDNYV